MFRSMVRVPELVRHEDLRTRRVCPSELFVSECIRATHLVARDDTILDGACESTSALYVVVVVGSSYGENARELRELTGEFMWGE